MKKRSNNLWASVIFGIMALYSMRSQQLELFRSDGKLGVRDATGKIVLAPIYDQIIGLNNGLIWLQQQRDQRPVFGYCRAQPFTLDSETYTTCR